MSCRPRDLVAPVALFAACAALVVEAAPGPQSPEHWLREHAVEVRSIAADDEDFSDLEPLVEAIGDARIVQLGESSHGAGATFSAKARLVRFLHQRMGFDVLVWESGMYDCRVVDEALRSGDDPIEAGRRGIFSIWSATEEVAPLLEYARASHARARPLLMAGFDIQFSGSARRYPDDLLAFLQAVPDGPIRARAIGLADDATRLFAGFRPAGDDAPPPAPGDFDEFLTSTRELVTLLDENAPLLHRVHAPREVAFWRRTIENLRLEGANVYERNAHPEQEPEDEQLERINRGWNRRDTGNAGNLIWLADEYYRGRKLIVWAHNGHIMNAYYSADWSTLDATPQEGGMKPVGVFLEETLGDDVYTIGFTSYTGTHAGGDTGGDEPIREAPPESLEYALHGLGEPFLFVDFRQLDDEPAHLLRSPSTMAIRGYMPEVMPDWTRVVDAVFFIDVQRPSTRTTVR